MWRLDVGMPLELFWVFQLRSIATTSVTPFFVAAVEKYVKAARDLIYNIGIPALNSGDAVYACIYSADAAALPILD
jgi:hypothetical protein